MYREKNATEPIYLHKLAVENKNTQTGAMKSRTFTFLLCIAMLPFRGNTQSGFMMPSNVKQLDIPFEYVNNFIVVTLMFNGTLPLKMIFDTGAEHTILSKREISDLLGVQYEREFRLLGADLKTELVAYLARQIRLETPNLPFVAATEDILVLQEDYFRFEEYAGINVHGILAAQTFARYIFKINYQRRVITVYDRANFKLPENEYEKVPVEIYRNKIYMYTQASFAPDSTSRIKLLMDTGAGLPLLLFSNTDSAVHAPPNVIPSNIGMGLGGYLEGFVGRTRELDVGSFKQNGIITYFQTLDTSRDLTYLNGRNGLIGNLLLTRFQVIVDYYGYNVWLKPSNIFRKNYVFDRSGLTIVAGGIALNQYTVQSVIAGSPAAEADIKPGDRIIRVGITPAGVLGLQDLVGIFQKKPGKKIRLTVLRDGKKMKKSFSLRELI
ncbi:MAG: aspartyl protease family protein [Saprospiraceae bacterium]|nr:aspartyl protease family protein [Saprospiraceae bacterium]